MTLGRVLILGGGYAGAYAALAAARARADANIDIRLISAAPDLINRPRLYEPSPGPHLRYPLRSMLDPIGVGLTVARVTDIDVTARRVTLSDGDGLSYDCLVVALGSAMERPSIPGMERAFDIDSYDAALRLDRHLRALPSRATVTVVGSGFTGIELATELASRFRVTLVERADVLSRSLGDGPRDAIRAALAGLGVEVKLGVRVDAIDGATTVWCGGMVANTLTRDLPAERDALGRLVTEPTLAVRGLPGVYAAGDVAHAMSDDAHTALMSCQHAIKLGQFAGHNAVAELLGSAPLPYRQPVYATCLDLGAAGAVLTSGWERQVVMTGPEAKARKREINTIWAALPSGPDRESLLAFGEPGASTYRRPVVA